MYIKNHPFCIEERAKTYYGLTDVFELAGYMLEDGSMLNFSIENRQRDEDHRNIGFFFKNAYGTDALIKFINRGNIRVSCNSNGYYFEFSKKLTNPQINRLIEAEKLARKYNLEFILEKSVKRGYKTSRKIYYRVCDYAEIA